MVSSPTRACIYHAFVSLAIPRAQVEFYAPWCGHCQKLAPDWSKAAKQLKPIQGANLGAVDCDVEKDLCSQFGVKGFPTIKSFGGDKTKPEDYNGARDASGIVSYVKEQLGRGGKDGEDKLAKKLKYTEVYNFLHLDTTPKVILLTKGEKTAPSWLTSLAVKYKEGKKRSVIFSYARHEDEPGVARNFKIEAFPALVYVQHHGKDGGWATTLGATKLSVERGSENLKKGKDFVDAALKQSQASSKPDDAIDIPSFPPPKVPRKQADTKYVAMNEDTINTHCLGGTKGICIVAVVNAPAGDEFAENAAMIEISKKYRNDPFSFLWIDASTQQGTFLEPLGLTAADAPKLVAIKTGKRNRFAVADESAISLATAVPFLDRILGGDMMYKNLEKTPEFEPAYLRNSVDKDEF